MGFNAIVREDKIVRTKVKRILKMESKDEAWIAELTDLQVSRGVGALTVTGLLANSKHESLTSNIDNQRIRSRCSVIKIYALKQVVVIEETLKYLRKYILYKFADELKVYSTLAAKKNAIELVLERPAQMLDRLNAVIKIADIVIEDSDQAGFTLKRIGDVLAITARDK